MIDLSKVSGTAYSEDPFLIFFGDRHLSPAIESRSLLAGTAVEPCLLHQVHGDVMVPASSLTEQKADAHCTRASGKLLLIKTADCLPIMIITPQPQMAVAIHAGWRGVEQKIVTKSLTDIGLLRDPLAQIYIGPHIHQQSFAVDADVARQLLTAHELTWNNHSIESTHPQWHSFSEKLKQGEVVFFQDGKFYVNLSLLVSWELHRLGFFAHQIHISDVDTRTHPDYFSYRRGDRDVRNYSGVLIK